MKPSRSRPSPWQRTALLALACLLVLVQLLGVMHRVAHASGHVKTTAQITVDDQGSVFNTHDAGSADCKLFDHLFHAEVLRASLPTYSFESPLAASITPWSAQALAAALLSFLARGPPRSGLF